MRQRRDIIKDFKRQRSIKCIQIPPPASSSKYGMHSAPHLGVYQQRLCVSDAQRNLLLRRSVAVSVVWCGYGACFPSSVRLDDEGRARAGSTTDATCKRDTRYSRVLGLHINICICIVFGYFFIAHKPSSFRWTKANTHWDARKKPTTICERSERDSDL